MSTGRRFANRRSWGARPS
ncbi:hypothetical protein LINPERHAP1_LOCUS10825 [Linum perenne]